MASRKKPVAAASPATTGPEQGSNNVFAAWQGLYHLFGARYDSFEITPEGVVYTGLRVAEPYNLDTIISDLSNHGGRTIQHRLNFFPNFYWAQGFEPAHFPTSQSLTDWMTQYLKGQGVKGRSPQYAKDAITAYKNAIGIAVPRGRPKKPVDLSNIDETLLAEVDIKEVTRLREAAEAVEAALK